MSIVHNLVGKYVRHEKYISKDFLSRFLFSVIMFLIVTARHVDVTYMFLQWLGDLTQVKSIDKGLDVFICSLKALYEQFVRNMIQNPIKYSFFHV